MEVHISTEKPYRYCWYGFGTVFQFQYQFGFVLRSDTELVPSWHWDGKTVPSTDSCVPTVWRTETPASMAGVSVSARTKLVDSLIKTMCSIFTKPIARVP